jgi:hypothetical protein
MARFDGLEYCKTDLIASKGIVFCKYQMASSALFALETITETGVVSGTRRLLKVTCHWNE